MYKVTNIYSEERSFKSDNAMYDLMPGEHVIVKDPPEPGIVWMVEQVKKEKRAAKRPEESDNHKEVNEND